MKKIIGYLMVVTPFIAFFVFITLKHNICAALLVYGITIFIIIFIWAAIELIFDE